MFDQWHQLASYSNWSPEWLKKLSRAPVVYPQPSTCQSVLITSTLHTLEEKKITIWHQNPKYYTAYYIK